MELTDLFGIDITDNINNLEIQIWEGMMQKNDAKVGLTKANRGQMAAMVAVSVASEHR